MLKEGEKVRFTAERLGLIESLMYPRFEPETVGAGDLGEYVGVHEALRKEGWHITRVEVDGRELFCPVHESQFEAVE